MGREVTRRGIGGGRATLPGKALLSRQPTPLLCRHSLSGQGISVLELVASMEKAVGKPIPKKMAPRRPGDIGTCYCDPAFAKSHLGWEAELGADEMCADTWRWQSANPNGYRKD